MCCGAIPWSGIKSLAVAGSGPEMERITGFDEGPIHPDWAAELRTRGIEVTDGILRNEALGVFRRYAAAGAPVYNGRAVKSAMKRRPGK